MHGSKSDGSFSVRIMKNIAPPSGTLGAPMPNVVHFFSPVFHIRPLYSSLWPSIVGLKSATKDESKSGGRHCETRDPCQTCLAVSRACACHAATDSCLHRNDSRLDSCCNGQGERRYTFAWHLRRFVLWRTTSPESVAETRINLERELS